MISGMVGQQMGMFAGYGGYAQQIGMGGGQMPMMGAPQMPQLSAIGAMRGGMGGMYGEQVAARMGNLGTTAMGVGMAGLGMMSAFAPIPMDPFSGAMMGARFGMGGAAMGAVGGAAMGLPLYAAGQAAQVYGGAFAGGMHEQAALNSTLRNNFQFMGGQGAFGRGFSQQQMGQIGSMMGGELRRSPFSSAQEMTSLVQGGADSGMFTAVRDVQQFTQRFRTMLNTLRDVQRELGGTLTDALQFVRGAQQSGIFRSSDQSNFAAEVRSAEAVTGMDRQSLIALSAQGSQISRGFGGLGRQGAMGALRGAQTLGAALSSGAINQEMLSEATGGLQGPEAIAAFTTNMLQRAGQFSRTGMGRYSLFAMSNANGTGLDQDMMQRMMSGDLTTGEVSRAAHGRVGGMGRARALNREGMLRGAVMEQGGMAAQIGMMRLMVGDRVLDQGDDLASLVLQRRFHMDRPQSEMMMSLMRNQGAIASSESIDRMASGRQQALSQDISENRSFDGFMRHLEHGMSDTMGVTRARELGRSFLTRISSLAERTMNDVLSVTASSMTTEDRRAMARMSIGQASQSDMDRLSVGSGVSGAGVSGSQAFGTPLAQRMLRGLGIETGYMSVGESLTARGVRGVRGMGASQLMEAVDSAQMARSGAVFGADANQLQRLSADANATRRDIMNAQVMAAAGGNASNFYQYMNGGASANAVDAFMAQNGMRVGGVSPTRAGLANARGGGDTLGGMGRDIMRMLGMGSGQMEQIMTPADQAASFITGGGHLAERLGREAGGPGASMDEAGARETQAALLRRSGYSEADIERSLGRRAAGGGAAAAMQLQGLRGVSEEAVRSVGGSDMFTRRIRRMSGMSGDRAGQQAELELLRQDVMAQGGAYADEGSAEGRAARSMIQQMEENIRSGGGIGSEFERFGIDEGRQRELIEGRLSTGADYSRLARRLGDTSMGRQFGALAGRFRDLSQSGSSLNTAAQDTMMQLARMDTSSAEYRALSESLGGDEFGREVLGAGAGIRQQVRALTGGGRRGGAQSAETALGMLTGNSFSEAGITVGGRQVDARRAMAILQRGGAGADEVARQLQTHLSGMGVSGSGDLVSQFRSMAGGGFSQSEAEQLIRMTTTGAAGGRLSEVQREAVMRQQQSRDPVAYQSMQHLGSAVELLRTISGQLPQVSGGVATGEPGD